MIGDMTAASIKLSRISMPTGVCVAESVRDKKSVESSSSGGPLMLSTLSQQLAESAVRAEARDRALSPKALGVEAQRLMTPIFGDTYQAARQKHNREIPKTEDPEMLERARLATEYLIRSDQRDDSVKNPFSGLSREQLNLIAYDEAGPYTINERRAAYCEVNNIESQWNRQVFKLYDMEAAANISNRPRFCTEVLSHYRSLPLIERAQYPDNYEARLIAQINGKDEQMMIDPGKLPTLFEVLARRWQSDRLGAKEDGAEGDHK